MACPPLPASVALGEDSCPSGSGEVGGITPFPGGVVSRQGWTPLIHCLLGHPGNILALIGSCGAWASWRQALSGTVGPWLLCLQDGLQPQLRWGNLPDKQVMTVSPCKAVG